MSTDLVRYPKAGVISPQRGLNLADNLFETRSDEAVILKNLVWRRNSLVQRYPFRNYSSTNFTADGVFRGAHDYKAPGGSARLLWATNGGKIKEWLTASTEADRVTGLSSGQEGYFATVFDAVFFINGSNALQVGRGTTWRQGGSPAAVSTLAVGTNAGATIAAGDYLHIVIPVIEVSAVSVVFANWSNIIKTTVPGGGIASFALTWTDIVDTRITAYLVFRTAANGTDFRSVARVATGVGAYTDSTLDSALPVTVTGGPSRAPARNSWGVPPVARIVVWCGNRLVFAGLDGKTNALRCGRIAGSSYEAEGVPPLDPTETSTLVELPKDGDITCAFPIGETGQNSSRANNLFVGQESACYILPETNPDIPLLEISGALGPISQRSIAQDGSFIFFQSRRGVEFWPGSGRDIHLLSDKVQPIFGGGGNQSLTANQSDADIRYCVAENQLWITVRDSGSATGPNKVYCMDLLTFRKSYNPLNPAQAARFTGPIENEETGDGLGFGLLLRRLDGSLLNFDNQNKRILAYDSTGSQDQIAGTNASMPVVVQHGALLKEDAVSQKILSYVHVLMFSNTNATLRFLAEFERITNQLTLQANTYSLLWDDINWTDINWEFDTWYQEAGFDFGSVACKWGSPRISKTDASVAFAYFGLILWLWPFGQIRTFR